MIHIPTCLDPARIRRQADLFSLLASPARVAIISALGGEDMGAGELVEFLAGLGCPGSMERTNVSKHLALLREAGVVSVSGEAQRRIYHLETPCILDAIDCVIDKGCAAASPERGTRQRTKKGACHG